MNPDPMLNNLIAWSLQIAAIVVAATVLPGVLRLRNPAAMLAYWRSVLAVCLLLPVLQPWHVSQVSGLLTSFSAELSGTDSRVGGKIMMVPVGGIIAYVLAAGTILRLFWLGLGLCRLRTLRRNASPIGSLPGLFTEMQTRVGVMAPIYLSPAVDSPVSFGFVRPSVIFPVRLLEMEEEKQRTVVCHELLHIRRRDWSFVLLEELIRALFWFHPAIWWALGRIQLSREQVVDREVLRITGARQAYLQALLEFAASGRAEAIPALPLLKQHQLTRRVALILKEDSMTLPRLILSLTFISIILIATCGLAVKSAPLNSRVVAENVSSEDAGSAIPPRSPKRVRPEGGIPKVVHQVDPEYPLEAERKGIIGNVIAEIAVDEHGRVMRVRVIEGHDALNEAVLNALPQWRFSPYQFDGRAVPIVARWTFNFSLKSSRQ
jgi:TonB family protein